ncbi:MAG: hypothetical protein KDN05_04160, partial [Verrucomicrobiae bacterium]|nr:hypothetical protein [Verrucomicrobiae bacterium]
NPSSFSAIIDLNTSGFAQSLFQGTTYNNDNFSQAKALTGAKAKALGYCRSASREAGEPAETGERSLWWKWKAPFDGKAIISTAGSDVGTKNRLTIGTGSRPSDLEYLSLGWDAPDSLVLDAGKGETYYIALGETNYFGLDNSSYILSIDHTKDAGNSPGKGKKAKFTTLPIDILNHREVKGVFTTKGITDYKIKFDTRRFAVGSVKVSQKKWSFVIHKTSRSVSPANGKFKVIGYRNGKAVAKVTKTFRVW